MSGHSKWSTIKHKKAATDARKGQMFTKMAREISIAAREGGGNPESNFRLRLAVQKAREVNMPHDNIERAIKRGTGELGGARIEELRYEGYGPHGVAIMLDVVTDNRNRTAPEIRNLFARAGGSLGESGAVGWMFSKRGIVTVEARGKTAEDISLQAIELGADDVNVDGQLVEVVTQPNRLEAVKEGLEKRGYQVAHAEVTMNPSSTVPLNESQATQVLRLLDQLEELDEVSAVYSNVDVPTEVLERISQRV
jgi:YebC/PmpR family DNA-binding regulatory protein